MTPAHEQPDLVEAAEAIMARLDRIASNYGSAHAHPRQPEFVALRSAITHERALRAEIVRVLKRCEYADSSHDEYSRMCQCCGAGASVKHVVDEDDCPIGVHHDGPYLPPYEATITRADDHAPDCALSALLARLDPKEGA